MNQQYIAALQYHTTQRLAALLLLLLGLLLYFVGQKPNLLNILRQSYDNAKVTIDLRRTSN